MSKWNKNYEAEHTTVSNEKSWAFNHKQ